MSGQAYQIANSVVTAINAKADYSNGFTPGAVRKAWVNLQGDFEDLNSVVVYVTPRAMVSEVATESQFKDDYRIWVTVIDRIPKKTTIGGSDDYDEDEIEKRFTLVEEIQTQIIQYADSNPGTLKTLGVVQNEPMLVDEQMELGIFVSATSFTFRHHRSV